MAVAQARNAAKESDALEMAHPLDGVNAKLVRAKEHIEHFHDCTRAILDPRPYRALAKID